MKSYQLTKKDYIEIKSLASKHYVEDASTSPDNFLVKCYTEAVITFMNTHKLIIQDGKLYEQEKKL